MRKLGLSLLLTSMVLVPYAALSQESQAPTADDYVCGLTGECADEATPEEAAPNSDGPRVTATRGFSLSRTTTAAPKATPPRPKQQTASRPAQRPVQRPAQPGRVDLRLAFGSGSSVLSAAAQNQVRALPGTHIKRIRRAHAGCPIGVGRPAPSPLAGSGRSPPASSS
jgi:hypothetical protein